MNSSVQSMIFAVLSAALVAPIAGQVVNPFQTPSRCYSEPTYSVVNPLCARARTQESCESGAGCWWRNTDNQNALGDSTASQHLGSVIQAYSGDGLDVYVWSSQDATNVVVLVSGNSYILVGQGGSSDAAQRAKNAFLATIPNFGVMTVAGIVHLSSHNEMIWGAPIFTNRSSPYVPDIPIYVESTWVASRQAQFNVLTAHGQRHALLEGASLSWGADAFLGNGTGYRNVATSPQPTHGPNIFVSAITDVYLGSTRLRLMPTAMGRGELSIHVPNARIVIMGPPFGKFLPNVAPLDGPALNVAKASSVLDTMVQLRATTLITLYSLPVWGETEVKQMLTAQRNALAYIHAETVKRINLGEPLDDIAATVTLPSPESPWTQPYATTVADVVRAVYQHELGWFDRGDVTAHAPQSKLEQATRLVELAGGQLAAQSAAARALEEDGGKGVAWALTLADALRRVAPSERATLIYRQALKRLAWAQKSGPLRNFYLSAAQ